MVARAVAIDVAIVATHLRTVMTTFFFITLYGMLCYDAHG